MNLNEALWRESQYEDARSYRKETELLRAEVKRLEREVRDLKQIIVDTRRLKRPMPEEPAK